MGLFDFIKSPKLIQGSIGYFGLEDWWLSTFNEKERQHIKSTFQPLGSSGDSLTSGKIGHTSQTVVGLLSALAGWFKKPEDRAIAHKILDKAEKVSGGASIRDVHFLYQQMIETYYKDRNKPEFMEKVLQACRKQITIAPEAAQSFKAEYGTSPLPSHKGYKQLAIVLEKESKYKEAIDLSLQAQSQGWAGNWEKRIERCKRKLAKA